MSQKYIGNVNNLKALFIISDGQNVQVKPEPFFLGLTDKQIGEKTPWNFVFIYNNRCKASICTEMEGVTYSHNGRIHGEINEVDRDGQIDCFD